jgi:exopolyphosphatase/guanosine-5'-triphosphate,3'-diphosphate pyrophosphatase
VVARGLVDSAKAAKANILGLALRLGQTLTGGVTTLLQRTSLTLDEETLNLTLPEDGRVMLGDSVQRRLEAVAKSLNRRGKITVNSARD